MKQKLWVKWLTKDERIIEKIRRRFDMPVYNTLNGLNPAEIDDADMELLRETAKKGYISILDAKWCKNGVHFAFISC